MKKTLAITTMLFSGLAFAQTEGTEVAPQYSIAQEEEAVLKNDFTFTLSGAICTADDKELFDTHMGFVALEWAHYVTENHAFTLEIGFGYGADDFGEPELYGENHKYFGYGHSNEDYYGSYEFQRMSFNMMVGFRTVIPIMRRLSATVGIKGGVDFQCLSLDHASNETYRPPYFDGDGFHPGGYRSDFEQDQVVWGVGFVYAAHAGLAFHVNEKVSLELGYQFRGTTAQPEVTNYWLEGTPPPKASKLNFHEIRFGIRGKF